ncbi:MAG: DUF4440 domain-containing protein [Pirellulales bacterium]
MSDATRQELIQLNQKLLDSIVSGDWKTYADLCDPTLSCFEPEARGNLVEGMPFHKFYFDLGAGEGPRTVTMSAPHVRLMGDSAIVSYIRLNQRLDPCGEPVVKPIEETRVWQKQPSGWKHVHFHRSAVV